MPNAAVDPSRLQGDALRQWYLRSPQEIESERQAAAGQRYDAFFGRPGGASIDPGFNTAVERPLRDIDPGFALIPKGNWRDIDPGFSAMPAGMNRWRIERPAADRIGESPDRLANYAVKPSMPTGEARAANEANSATPRPSAPAVPSAPPSYLDNLRRRRQAEFDRAARDADIQNSWFAVPALAPAAAVLGLEGAAALSGDAVASQAARAPFSFIEREAWQGRAAVDKVAGRLSDAAKTVMRREGRARLAQANGTSASEMGA